MKTWLLALGALSVLIAQPRIANAAITAATFKVIGANPYNGLCPTNVSFAGTVTGTPGTSFTVSLNRFVNGTQHVVDLPPVTMPANGQEPVNDSISISASAKANTFDQIWVHKISGGQPDVYSNKANFIVNCGFFGPIPKGLTVFTPPPPPDSLTNTTDPPTCTNHGGFGAGLACLAGIPKGQLALIWNWSPVKGVPNVNGYKIYRVDGGQHTLIPANGAYSNDGTVTVAVLDTPADGFNGKCYVVTALEGTTESHDSNFFCAGGYQGGPIVESFTVQPTAMQTFSHHYHFDGPCAGLSKSGTGPGTGPSGNEVGFNHNYEFSGVVTCAVDNTAWETALGFDLGAAGIVLRGSKASVKSATLTFQRTDGSKSSCVAGVHLPTIDWSNFGGQMIPVPHDDYRGNIPWNSAGVNTDQGVVKISNGGGSYVIDVASAVNDFAKGNRPNHGFLLVGGNEDFSGEDNAYCFAYYGGFTLNIQVVINP
jgi:hypothetical protein